MRSLPLAVILNVYLGAPGLAAAASEDVAAAQRGFVVYQQKCASCHAISGFRYTDLTELGLTRAQALSLAQAGDGRKKHALTDGITAPEKGSAKDLSRVALFYRDGAEGIEKFLMGYKSDAANITLGEGIYYNAYAQGGRTPMPPPWGADTSAVRRQQEARDVTGFLSWLAQPHLQARHRLSFAFALYCTVLLGFVFILFKRIQKK